MSADPVLVALAAAQHPESEGDAALLALAKPLQLAEAGLAAAFADIEARGGGASETSAQSDDAFAVKIAIASCIFATPARTLDGLLFKREVLNEWDGCEEAVAFRASIDADLLSMINARKLSVAPAHAKVA